MAIPLQFIVIALLAGIAALQGPINTQLSARTGLMAANVFSNVVGTLALVAVMAALEPQALSIHYWMTRMKPGQCPSVLWFGGILGSLFMVTMVIAVPRIGARGWVMAALAGQLAAALVVDSQGLFGLVKRGVGWQQIVGVALVIGGALLALKSH